MGRGERRGRGGERVKKGGWPFVFLLVKGSSLFVYGSFFFHLRVIRVITEREERREDGKSKEEPEGVYKGI